MKNTKIKSSILLIITSLVWGIAFVAQSEGGNAVGPFSFNCIRSIIGSIVLLPVIFILDKLKITTKKASAKEERKKLILGGILCGIALFLASSMQQLGMYMGTPAGKAGFLTACYILLVPILGLFFGKKCGWNIWLGVGMTLIGLYLLCMSDSLGFRAGDIMVLMCAFLFSAHILIIDYFSPLVDGVRMSCIQFLVCGILSMFPMFFIDMKHSSAGISEWLPKLAGMDAWLPILYAGIMSCGVAYTFQIVGQKGLNPTIASLLMSLESVFSVIAGWFLLGQRLGVGELVGCAIMFIAIIFAQLPIGHRENMYENYGKKS